MSRSTLQSFVSGMRQVLTLQLLTGIAAVGLAGWTMAVTNEVIRQRDDLRARVAQLETELEINDIASPPVIEAPKPEDVEEAATEPEEPAETTTPTPTPTTTPPVVTPEPAPVPEFQQIFLHIGSDADREEATLLARDLRATGLTVSIDTVANRAGAPPRFGYHDASQRELAAALFERVRAAATRRQYEAWARDARGFYLEGEPATRFEVWLPPLPVAETPTPPTQTTPTPPSNTDTTTTRPPAFDPGTIFNQVFAPPPALETAVLHIRSEADRDEAVQVARQLSAAGVRVSIEVLSPNDQRASGYAYYHPRQNRAAGTLAQRLQAIAREAQIAAWSEALNGSAAAATTETPATRVDFLLPALPTSPTILRRAVTPAQRLRQIEPQTPPPSPIR